MYDCNRNEIMEWLSKKERIFVYFYSPFCGTCQVATKMLKAIPMKDKINLVSCNVNLVSELAQSLKIESIPCLLIKDDDTIIEKIYTFRSLEYLYSLFYKYR